MKILFISDVHFGKDTVYPIVGNKNYITYGTTFVSLFSKIKHDADIVIDLGDSISAQNSALDFENYRLYLSYFKDLDSYHIIGNHETRNLTPSQISSLNGQNDLYFSFDKLNVHHIILNSKWVGTPLAIDLEQINWLMNDMNSTNLPIMVYLHYPCDEQVVSKNSFFDNHENWFFIREREKLRKIFENSGKVKLVAFGHSHYFNVQLINGITYLNVPSFTQNDGTGKPSGTYIEVSITDFINIELKKVF